MTSANGLTIKDTKSKKHVVWLPEFVMGQEIQNFADFICEWPPMLRRANQKRIWRRNDTWSCQPEPHWACGSVKRRFQGLVTALGKARQKWEARAETEFTQPGDRILAEPCR